MILHLCHHWFWITSLSVLLIMTVITRAHDEELSNRDTSHLNPVRSKFKAVLLNVTRLYPVPAIVPDGTHSSTPEGIYSSSSGLVSTTNQPLAPSNVGLLSSEVEIVVPGGLSPFDKQSTLSISDRQSEESSQSGNNSASDRQYEDKDFSSGISPGDKASSSDTSAGDKASSRGTSADDQWSRIDTALFASESVESKELPDITSQSSNSNSQPSVSSNIDKQSQVAISQSSTAELLTDSDSAVSGTNQSERLEREIRKNNASQSIDIHLHPSFETGSDGLEHDKLSQHTQEFVRRISTTETPVNDTSIPEVKNIVEEPYTIFVTPSSLYSTSNDLTTQSISTPTTQAIEIVKKSENLSKIKDKVDFKAKFSSKTKDKTTPLKVVTETTSVSSQGVTSSTTVSQAVEDLTSPASIHTRTNSSKLENYEVLNDSPESPESQENVTELAFENTSISADYEDAINLTSASSNMNTSTITRNTGHGRALDTHERVVDSSYNRGRSLDKDPLPQAHAEDLQNSNPWASNDINVALISGVSFGALALVTLFGAVSFIMYRRYRWNKPQTLSDKCSNPDSSGYIDDSTLRENSEEMYSLDNDSFLNSLEAMTIQNYWTDHVKHTKL